MWDHVEAGAVTLGRRCLKDLGDLAHLEYLIC